MGAPAAKCAEKRPGKRANAYEQCIISQAERGGATSNKIPDKSTFSNACAIFSCKDWNERAIFEMHPLRLVQPFLKPAWGTHPATLAYESRTARRRVTCWFIFSITTEYEDASRAEWILLPFRAFPRKKRHANGTLTLNVHVLFEKGQAPERHSDAAPFCAVRTRMA